MHRYITGLLCSLLLFAFGSCKQDVGNKFQITASIKGMPPVDVMIKEVGFQNSVFIDSTHSNDNGSFTLSGVYDEPGLYNIKLGSNFLMVVIDQPKMHIEADWSDLSQLKISGSPATASLNKFNNEYVRLSKKLIGNRMAYDSLMKANASDSVLRMIELATNENNKQLITYIKNYADTTKSLPVAIYVASNLLASDQADYLQDFAAKLNTRFPEKSDNTFALDFKAAVKAKLASMKTEQHGPSIGSIAPDFKTNTIDGKQVSLSDFRGEYVLLDFWASWCPPCRAENPNVVAAYNTFKNRNFTILSFSLDNNHTKWEDAIKSDNLSWTQASDLQGWSSSVVSLYGVEAIPMNFLIAPDGKIIARNLRGSSLEATLQQQLPRSVSDKKLTKE